MERVIVGFDGSADAELALRWATRYARDNVAAVTAYLVWSTEHCPPAVLRAAERLDPRGLEIAAARVLSEAVHRHADAGLPRPVDERAVAGEPAAVLLGATRSAGLLVLGRHGADRRRHLHGGSVSAECLHRSGVPVVVVRAEAPGSADGPVVVGVDGSPASIAALRWAAGQARRHDVPLRVVHSWRPTVSVVAGYPSGLEHPTLRAAARHVLDSSVAAGLGGDRAKVEPLLVVGGVGGGLIEAAAGAQLLVVGARGGGGFPDLSVGSIAQQCVQYAPCPIAVIRGRAGGQPAGAD